MPGYDWNEDDLITHGRLNDQNARVAEGVLAPGAQHAKIFSWQNTVVGGAIIVWWAGVSIRTGSTAAAAINVGQAATEVESDNLIDGAALNVVALKNSVEDAGVNGKGGVYVADNHWITGWEDDTEDPADLVGKYYIHYTLV